MSAAMAHYQAEFEQFRALRAEQEAPIWREWRDASWEHFAATGFPGAKHEEWKYTSLAALEKLSLSCLPAPMTSLPWELVQPLLLLNDTPRLVFLDGAFSPLLSRLEHLPAGLILAPVSARIGADPSAVQEAMLRTRTVTPFAALNGAFTTEGVWIETAPGFKANTPLLTVYLNTGWRAVHALNVVRLGAESQLTWVEQHLGVENTPYFVNHVSDLGLNAGARLVHLKLQQEAAQSYHLALTQTRQEKGSNLDSHFYALQGALGRNDVQVALEQPGAQVSLKGLYRVHSRELQDFHTRIDHRAPKCRSEECFKGILDGSGRAVFNGKVVVAKHAQGTDSQQSNHNLLLSDQAEVDTKPQLEIYADDVRCTHGATVGQLDANSLFYLRSRGLGEVEARALLINAFALETLEAIPDLTVRGALDRLLRRVEPE